MKVAKFAFSEGSWEQPRICMGFPAEYYERYDDPQAFFDDGRPIPDKYQPPDAAYNRERNLIYLHCREEAVLRDFCHELHHWATEYLLDDDSLVDHETCEQIATWGEAIPESQERERLRILLGSRHVQHGRRSA